MQTSICTIYLRICKCCICIYYVYSCILCLVLQMTMIIIIIYTLPKVTYALHASTQIRHTNHNYPLLYKYTPQVMIVNRPITTLSAPAYLRARVCGSACGSYSPLSPPLLHPYPLQLPASSPPSPCAHPWQGRSWMQYQYQQQQQ